MKKVLIVLKLVGVFIIFSSIMIYSFYIDKTENLDVLTTLAAKAIYKVPSDIELKYEWISNSYTATVNGTNYVFIFEKDDKGNPIIKSVWRRYFTKDLIKEE